jgi:hypothetical protein
MRRFAFTTAALVSSLAFAPGAFAQAPKAASKTTAAATPATPAPSPDVVRARMRTPVKGTAYVDIIKGTSKKVGTDVVTITKVKNTSDAPIAGLRIDEWWYAGKEQVSGGTGRVRQPVAPGEIIEVTTTSPWKPGMTGSQLQFTHANGTVKVTAVKTFAPAKK